MKTCHEHGKELTLFCKETQCQTLICSICLTRRHRKHDIVDAHENRKDELQDNLTSAIETLSFKKDQMKTAQSTAERKTDNCLQKLTEEKRSTLNIVRNRFNSLIADVLKQKAEYSFPSGNEMTSLEDNLILLSNIQQYVNDEMLSPRDVKNCQDTVSSITQHTDYTLLGQRTYGFMEYTENKDKEKVVEELCGQLTRRKHSMKQYGRFSRQSDGMFTSQKGTGKMAVIDEPANVRLIREIQERSTLASSSYQKILPNFRRKS